MLELSFRLTANISEFGDFIESAEFSANSEKSDFREVTDTR
jgi:hypothetical protein